MFPCFVQNFYNPPKGYGCLIDEMKTNLEHPKTGLTEITLEKGSKYKSKTQTVERV